MGVIDSAIEVARRLEVMQVVMQDLASTNPFLRDEFDRNKAALDRFWSAHLTQSILANRRGEE